MNYEAFKEKITEDIKQSLYEKGMEDVIVDFQHVEKENQSYEAMTVVQEDSIVGVNMNIEKIYEDYENTKDYPGIMSSLKENITVAMEKKPEVDVMQLMNYDSMKEKLSVEVISAETNSELLKKIPHDKIEDMAVVYRFIVEKNENGTASILANNDLIERMGVTYEQLRNDALETAAENRPAVIQGMYEMLKESGQDNMLDMMGITESTPELMYVASVPDKNMGAGVIAYENFMDQAAEKLGGDFFVLPSSVHEVLLLPDDGVTPAAELKEMVTIINATDVKPEDKLTDSVYHFDSKEHVFELAEKFEARQQGKEAAFDTEEKTGEHGSVLKSLKDKQKETSKTPAKDAVKKEVKSKGGEVL